jgi:GrpB-like predicted nucleotidyltransferase (UPF0157 family)
MLVAYDPSWLERFELLAAEIRTHGDEAWTVEHIGSTAVPGLRAKPIIDLAVRIASVADLERHRPALEAKGWQIGSGVRSHPVMILTAGERRVAIAHFFAAADWETVNQRILRDWLLGHPDDVVLYEQAKESAVVSAQEGTTAYNEAKTAVIQEIVDRARAARGLASVPVSDKA